MEEKNAQEKKDNDFLELIKKIEKNMKKYAIEDIRQEIVFLISIMMIKNVDEKVKKNAEKILEREYGVGRHGYLDFYLFYTHPRFIYLDLPEPEEFKDILKPYMYKNLYERVFYGRKETVEEKKLRIKDKIKQIAEQIDICPEYNHLKRVKYMLEVQLSRVENNLPDLSTKELRELVIKNGYMTEDLEYDINTRKRLKLKEYYYEDED